jgi:hypothetical protein
MEYAVNAETKQGDVIILLAAALRGCPGLRGRPKSLMVLGQPEPPPFHLAEVLFFMRIAGFIGHSPRLGSTTAEICGEPYVRDHIVLPQLIVEGSGQISSNACVNYC